MCECDKRQEARLYLTNVIWKRNEKKNLIFMYLYLLLIILTREHKDTYTCKTLTDDTIDTWHYIHIDDDNIIDYREWK